VEAYNKLADPEQSTQLLDIRAPADIKAEGSPSLKSIRKTVMKVSYAADDDKFVDKVLAKCKIADDTTLYVLDRFDGNAAVVAKLLANSGFKSAYAIKGGAEGTNGWLDKDLPWMSPAKSFSLNLDGLKGAIKDGGEVDSATLSTTLGVAAAAGVGIVALSEVETTLQVLGTVALVQLFIKKFLFAEDRKNTIEEIKTFFNSKIAPKDFVGDIKEVKNVILPSKSEVKAAINTGAGVIERELNIDSVTPETLATKAKEKIYEEAEKSGVELPDVDAITADLKSGAKELQSNVETVTSDIKEGTQDLQAQAENVTSDLQSKAEDVASDVKAGAQELQSQAEDVASDAQAKAEDVATDIQEGTTDLQSKAKDVASDAQSKTEEVASDLKSGAQEVASDAQSKTEEVASDLKSGAQEVASDAQAKTEEVTSDLKSGAEDAQSKTEEVTSDLKSETQSAVGATPTKTEEVTSDLMSETQSAVGATPTTPSNGSASNEKVKPFFDSDRESAAAAFEGDEPMEVPQVGEDITAKKLEEVTASGSTDTSS
jgi:rhodanese-related sulfurtransferase